MNQMHDNILVYPIGKVADDETTTIIDLRVWRETDRVFDISLRCSGNHFQPNMVYDVEFLFDNTTAIKKEKIKYDPEKCLLKVPVNKAEELKLQNGRSKKFLKVFVYDSGSKKALFESEKFIRRKTPVKPPAKIKSSKDSDCTFSTIDDNSSFMHSRDDNESNDSYQLGFATSTPDVFFQRSPILESSILSKNIDEKANECDINLYKCPLKQPSTEYVFDERVWSKFPDHAIKLRLKNATLSSANFAINITKRDLNQNEWVITSIDCNDTDADSDWIDIFLRMKEEKDFQTIDDEQFKIVIVDFDNTALFESNWFERRKFAPLNDTASEDLSLSSLQSVDERNILELCHAFTLIISQEEVPNSVKLDRYIYLEPIEPKYPSNHAFRTFIRKHDVKFVASFKIDNRMSEKSPDRDMNKDQLSKFLFQLLDDGIEAPIDTGTEKLQVKFLYFGHSSSGMREGNFWAVDNFCVKKSDIEAFMNGLGQFSDLESPEKLCKRYGQSFSTSTETIQLRKEEYVCTEDDVCQDDDGEQYEITDGIGMMRMSVAKEMSEKLQLNYVCNVFQIRCAGFKGVLSAWPDHIFDQHLAELATKRDKSLIRVIFRKSQKKFKFSSEFITLNAVNWMAFSLPPAALNSEFLMILDGCDNSNGKIRNAILKLYEDNLSEIEESMIDSAKALAKLSVIKQNEFTAKFMNILLACGKNFQTSLDSETCELIQGLIINQTLIPSIMKRKLNIVIDKSRYLIGIIDETNSLDEDEVFVSYRDSSDCLNYLNAVPIIVCRNPCYALGEMRRVMTRDVPELRHLENVIVFSKQGKRPLPNMLSGGDLDGDLYFVSWDERITDMDNDAPLHYPKSKVTGKMTSKDLRSEIIKTFVKSVLSNSSIGLWHYYLLSMYDSDRANMRLEDYKIGVFNINKCIDGILITDEPPNVRPPSWYLTRKLLKDLNYSDNRMDSITYKKRIDGLLKIIDQYRLVDKSRGERDSLVGQLMYKTFQKFYRIASLMKCERNDVSFFSQADIDILHRDDKINLNLVDNELDDFMFGEIRKAHIDYLQRLNKLEKSKGKKSRKLSNGLGLFKGAAEISLLGKNNGSLEMQKAMLKKEFRDFVFHYKYKIEDSFGDRTLSQLLYNDSGVFAYSRIVKLYLTCLGRKESCMYLAWEFYDILCFLKNYSNCKQSQSSNSFMYLSVPFTVPIAAFGAICTSVTKRLYSLNVKDKHENDSENNK
jgi:hypothetical protein